jgi:hypothetical protein
MLSNMDEACKITLSESLSCRLTATVPSWTMILLLTRSSWMPSTTASSTRRRYASACTHVHLCVCKHTYADHIHVKPRAVIWGINSSTRVHGWPVKYQTQPDTKVCIFWASYLILTVIIILVSVCRSREPSSHVIQNT